MKKGMFLENWELVAIFNMMAFVDYDNKIEMGKEERETMLKIRNYLEKEQKESGKILL